MTGPQKIRALVVTPDGGAQVVETGTGLADFQRLVGGYLEGVGSSVTAEWFAYCDEEGKLKGLPPNIRATDLAISLGWRSNGDSLCGPVVFVGMKEGEETDVPSFVVETA